MTAGPAAATPAPLPGPTTFDTGLTDDVAFQTTPTAVSDEWLARTEAAGSSWVRLGVLWSQIAPATPPPGFDARDPADPAYNWTALDGVVQSAVADHQRVLLQILFAPTWATGPGAPTSVEPGTWEPDPTALADFAYALASRYDGLFVPAGSSTPLPAVSAFQVWNEPNLPGDLTPQWVRRGASYVAVSPTVYRNMLNAGYAAIKQVNPRDLVIAAGTAPYGDPPGVGRMAPVTFLEDLMCLRGSRLTPTACPDPPHLDALDHHPYALTPTIQAVSPDDVSVPDLSRIERVVAAARRAHTLLPVGPKPIWVTEIAWQSNPPEAGGLSLALQARYVAEAFYALWSQGVGHVFWLAIHDEPDPLAAGAGLYFADGVPKPALTAFAFPFVALHRHGQTVLWGRAPQPGDAGIQMLRHGRWQTLTTLPTTAGGVFYGTRQLPSGAELRAVDGSATSLNWKLA